MFGTQDFPVPYTVSGGMNLFFQFQEGAKEDLFLAHRMVVQLGTFRVTIPPFVSLRSCGLSVVNLTDL